MADPIKRTRSSCFATCDPNDKEYCNHPTEGKCQAYDKCAKAKTIAIEKLGSNGSKRYVDMTEKEQLTIEALLIDKGDRERKVETSVESTPSNSAAIDDIEAQISKELNQSLDVSSPIVPVIPQETEMAPRRGRKPKRISIIKQEEKAKEQSEIASTSVAIVNDDVIKKADPPYIMDEKIMGEVICSNFYILFHPIFKAILPDFFANKIKINVISPYKAELLIKTINVHNDMLTRVGYAEIDGVNVNLFVPVNIVDKDMCYASENCVHVITAKNVDQGINLIVFCMNSILKYLNFLNSLPIIDNTKNSTINPQDDVIDDEKQKVIFKRKRGRPANKASKRGRPKKV